MTYASREGVRGWVRRLSIMFRPRRKPRRLVSVDETVVKRLGINHYLWAAIDVDSGEIIALYTSRDRSMARALAFLRRVLEACSGSGWRPMVQMGIKEAGDTILPRDIRE